MDEGDEGDDGEDGETEVLGEMRERRGGWESGRVQLREVVLIKSAEGRK